MMTRELIARLRGVTQWEGVPGLLRRMLRLSVGRVLWVRRLLFFETDLTGPLPALSARVPLEMRVATREDFVRSARDLRALGVDLTAARRALDRGDLATLGFSGELLVHIAWLTFTSPWVDEIGRTLVLEPGEAVGYASMTLREWRGHGIQPAAGISRNRLLRDSGYRRQLAWVWADNISSLRTQVKRDRRRTKTVWVVSLIGLRRPLVLGATRTGSPSLVRAPDPRPACPVARAPHRPGVEELGRRGPVQP